MADTDAYIEWAMTSGLIEPSPDQFLAMLPDYHPFEKRPEDPVVIMVLGVPGAGKDTIINEYTERWPGFTKVYGTGDVMWDLVHREHPEIPNRDSMRNVLSPADQASYQRTAVAEVGRRCRERNIAHLVHCHTTTFAKSRGGFVLGIGPENWGHYRPDAVLYIDATPSTIAERRQRDTTRVREADQAEILLHDEVNLGVLKIVTMASEVPVRYIPTETLDDVPVAVAHLRELVEYARPIELQGIDGTNSQGNPTSPYLLNQRFIRFISRRVADISKSAADVRKRSRQFSGGKVVYLMNNLEGGSVFQYGLDHWSSQLRTLEDALEFVDRVKKTGYWKTYIELLNDPKAVSRLVVGEHRYKANYSNEVAQCYRDLAIVSVAQQFLDETRIVNEKNEKKVGPFVYPISDTRISSDHNEVGYFGGIFARIEEVVKFPGIKVMLADTRASGNPRSLMWYERGIIAPIKSGDSGWMDEHFLRYDPHSRVDFKAWWEYIPEAIYPACDVNCQTNIGTMTLKDYLRIAVSRASGAYDTRKGWEHKIDAMLGQANNS